LNKFFPPIVVIRFWYCFVCFASGWLLVIHP